MSISIKSNLGTNYAVSFGNISQDAKKVINRTDIRKVLEERYGISAQHLRLMDESRIKVSLLSSKIKDCNLPETAGLIISAPNKAGIKSQILASNAKQDIPREGVERFAYFVKKAFDMICFYGMSVKEYSTHEIAKSAQEGLQKTNRAVSQMLRACRDNYNGHVNLDEPLQALQGAEHGAEKIHTDLKSAQKELKYGLSECVNSGWEFIKKDYAEA